MVPYDCCSFQEPCACHRYRGSQHAHLGALYRVHLAPAVHDRRVEVDYLAQRERPFYRTWLPDTDIEIQPLRYGFEALVVNEFHGLESACSNLVPQGPAYANVSLANQVCTTVGSVPGSTTVLGDAYISTSYNYSYSHLWRNFGVVCAFGIGFISILLFLYEINQSLAGQSTVILFKRGYKYDVVNAAQEKASSDEEKGHGSGAAVPKESGIDISEMKAAAPEVHDTFSFHHLNYTVPVGGGNMRQLLDDVSGYAPPGRLTALMGESGAGKTTLLNVLAERTTGGVVSGNRYMNGHPLPPDFQAHTGYCQQMDTHLPTATVREALLFSAELRQPPEVPLEEKKAYVEKVLVMCGLKAYGDVVVGSLGVEHRKRTTIAVELVAKPSLIFLDEPTSGLDSQSAWAITSFLRDLADSGQAIICTIHQPSAELFQVFDRLLLLRKGGQTVYFGDIGPRSATMIEYFERNGARKCTDTENPAEYILEAIGAGATATTEIDWYSAWCNSPEADGVQAELERIHSEGRKKPPVQARLAKTYPTTWFYQLVLLLRRNAQAYWRDPVYLIAKIALNIAAALLIGFTFYKAKLTIQGTQNHLFAVFMSLIISVPLSNQLQVPFIDIRNIYEVRERHSRMYSWTALVTSQILIEIPWNILGSSLYFLCWFWTVGFPTSRAGFTYLVMGIFYPLYYTTVGQAVAAMAPNAEIAALLFSFLFSFVLTLYVSFFRALLCDDQADGMTVATALCSPSLSSGGGSGCTVYHRTPTLSKVSSATRLATSLSPAPPPSWCQSHLPLGRRADSIWTRTSRWWEGTLRTGTRQTLADSASSRPRTGSWRTASTSSTPTTGAIWGSSLRSSLST